MHMILYYDVSQGTPGAWACGIVGGARAAGDGELGIASTEPGSASTFSKGWL